MRANADTPVDAQRAREVGAEGIGLVRTEHMFFAPDRIPIMREMIMAPTRRTQQAALDRLQLFQRDDFIGIFRAMDGPARHHPAARPAAARVPGLAKEYKEMVEEKSRLEALAINPERQQWLEDMLGAGRAPAVRRTRCSAIAAAVSASPRPASTACR